MPISQLELDEAIALSDQNPNDLELAEAAITIADSFQFEKQQRQEATRTIFTDPNHGFSSDQLSELTNMVNGDEERKYKLLNKRYFQELGGIPKDQVDSNIDQLINAYGLQEYNTPISSHKEFFNSIKSDFLAQDQVAAMAEEFSLSKAGELDAELQFRERMASVPGYAGREGKWKDEFFRFKGVIDNKRDQYSNSIWLLSNGLERKNLEDTVSPVARFSKFGGTEEPTEAQLRRRQEISQSPSNMELAEVLMEVPAEDRPFVISAAVADAAKDGRGRKDILLNLADSVERGFSQYAEGFPLLEKKTRAIGIKATIRSGFPVSEEDAATPEAYFKAATSQLTTSTSSGLSEFGDILPTRQVENPAQPSEEVKAGALKLADRLIEAADLTTQIRNAAEQDVDPITSDSVAMRGIYALARSTPYMVAAALPGGAFVNTAAFVEQGYQMVRSMNPNMTAEQAMGIGVIAAPFMTFIERMQLKAATGQLKSLKRFFNEVIATPGGATSRVLARTTLTAGLEMVQENFQDVTPFMVQGIISAVSEDMPNVPVELLYKDMVAQQPELFFAVLPLAIMGGGAGTYSDFRNGRALLSSYDELTAQGLSEAASADIRALAAKGDYDGAQSRLREEFKTLGKDQVAVQEARAKALPKLLAEYKAQQAALDSGIELDILPAILQQRDGKVALRFTNGQEVQYDSHAQAMERFDQIASTAVLKLHRDMITAAKMTTSQMDQGREVKLIISPLDLTTTELEEQGVASAEQLQKRKEIADVDKGITPKAEEAKARALTGISANSSQARTAASYVLGSSVNAPAAADSFGDRVIRTTARVYKQANPYTVIEEVAEGDIKFMITEGRVERPWLISALRQWEGQMGDALFRKSITDDSQVENQDIVEAYSKMVVSYFAGRATAGDQGRIFSKQFRNEIAKALRMDMNAVLTGYASLFEAVYRRAGMIEKARKEGTLPADLESFLAKSAGMSPQKVFEREVVKEGEGIARELQRGPQLDPQVTVVEEGEGFRRTMLPDGSIIEGPATLSIISFHGTPHKVDKFATAKIGTGEGAQAYGWGLYFAEKRSTAENYQTILSKNKQAEEWLRFSSENPEQASDFAEAVSNRSNTSLGDTELGVELQNALAGYVDYGVPIDGANVVTGNTYTLELFVEQEDLLDWNKPLSEQSEKVKAALSRLSINRMSVDGLDMGGGSSIRDNRKGQFDKSKPYPWLLVTGKSVFGLSQNDVDRMTKEQANPTGENVYTRLTSSEGSQKSASEKLAALGIPGIRYLDGNSRSAGEGSYNYVIFDDKLIKILEENGTPVTAPTDAGTTLSVITPAVDAEYLALAADPEKNQARLQEMVDEAYLAATKKRDKTLAEYLYMDAALANPPPLANDLKQAWEFGKRTVGMSDSEAVYSGLVPDWVFNFGHATNEFFEAGRREEVPEFVVGWRRGDIPEGGRSKNHASNDAEPGVSLAYAHRRTDMELNAMTMIGVGGRPKVFVQGWAFPKSRWGSDGEIVVLSAKKLEPIKKESGNVIPLSQRFNPARDEISFSFAGASAQVPQFMRDSLDAAQAMAAAGKTSEEIRAITGWFPGKYDGKMRWEIPDEDAALRLDEYRAALQEEDSAREIVGRFYADKARREMDEAQETVAEMPMAEILKLSKQVEASKQADAEMLFRFYAGEANPNRVNNRIPLGYFLDHSKLFEMYPDLKAVPVSFSPNDASGDGSYLGSYTPSTGVLFLNPLRFDDQNEMLSTTLHEVQHWIQDKEGFAVGTSPAVSDILAQKGLLGDAYKQYFITAGEIEARDVQARRLFTSEQRKAIAPYSSENIAPEDAIVLFGQRSATSFSTITAIGDIDSKFAAMFSPFQRSPELRAKLGLAMREKTIEVETKLLPIIRSFYRTKKDMQREASAREGFEYDRLLRETFGADTPAKQDALPAVDRQAARSDAKRIADQWMEGEMKKKEVAPRETLIGFLRTLDAIQRTLPVEVRGKIGGFVALAELSSPAAMLEEIERRVKRIDSELEKYLKKEAEVRRKKLFKRAKPKRESGKKPSGKAGADIHDLFDRLAEAMLWDGDQAEAWATMLEAKIAKGELTPEAEAHAAIEANLVRLFSDWNDTYADTGKKGKNGRRIVKLQSRGADAARRTAAIDAAEEVFRAGYLAEQTRIAKERERRAQIRADIIKGTGKLGNRSERAVKAQMDAGLSGQWKEWFLSLFNFDQVLGFAFGAESKWTTWFADQQRIAENQKIDEVQSVLDGLDNLFRTLGGSRLGGEKLQWKLSQPSFQTKQGGMMSELEGITAILMWRQEDGKRHMKGKRDENGKITSTWAYDQSFIDEIGRNLSKEGLAVMDYLIEQYAGEYETLNPIFREINGINLPRTSKYSPLSVKPQQAPSGQTTDPVTGSTMSNGSMTPGSLRTRAQVVAEPDFRNAVEVFVGHKKQLAHWKAFAVFVRDAQAILGNREVSNSIEASSGQEAIRVIKSWLDMFAQGGVRDAGSHLALTKALAGATGRAAAIQLVGRVGTLAIQTTQLGAAAAKMPFISYVSRLSKLLTGRLAWGDALNSPYIRRRLAEMPVSIQLAMEGLRAKEPNALKHAVQRIGRLLSGTDALFTAGTFAIVYDYQLTKSIKAGVDPVTAAEVARNEAERIVDEIAQPTRQGTRSLFEATATNPLGRVSWAFASEARKNMALIAYTGAKRPTKELSRALFYVVAINGILASLIRTAWKDLRDDDEDEDEWSLQRMLLSVATEPLYGFPGFGEIAQDAIFAAAGEWQPSGSILDAPVKVMPAIVRAPENFAMLREGDLKQPLRDLETILMAGGLFNENIAALSSLSHVIRDAEGLIRNFTQD